MPSKKKNEKKPKLNKDSDPSPTAQDSNNNNNDNNNGRGKKIITDAQFVSMHSDPHFQKVSRHKSKVAIDSRFDRMFKEVAGFFWVSVAVGGWAVQYTMGYESGSPSQEGRDEGAPSVIDRDTWVMCDRCQTWRLLPFGTSPKDLPEKWICSMLDWLPGMNRCTFTEAETTQALVALYQVAPESQTNLHGNPGGAISGVTFANVRDPDQNDKNIGLHFMPSGGKKKDGLKETSDATYKDGPSKLSNSMEKNLQASVKDLYILSHLGMPGAHVWSLSFFVFSLWVGDKPESVIPIESGMAGNLSLFGLGQIGLSLFPLCSLLVLEVLLKFDVCEEEIAKLTRWHRIAMIRKLSSEQAASGIQIVVFSEQLSRHFKYLIYIAIGASLARKLTKLH
ncbi:hypothetical protein SO802_029215 [Lithocarpus litseifolius]|uniref:CW-type domain-containing protein n=1 Tax=Lithocarpus litseifolius TaxID=425828 RepID=A0AAW2BUH1_9ROSI